MKKLLAEFIGTFTLVFGGCGSAILAASFPETGIGFTGVAFAFGLSLMVMVYAFGPSSGGHFNPAVTLGLWLAKRFPAKDIPAYWIAQLIGGIAAAACLYVIASDHAGFQAGSFASNGYGSLSPDNYGIFAAFLIELILTAIFIIVILSTTSQNQLKAMAPLAIGFTLALIHLISIPVTNTSVNPARSTAVALFAQTDALNQLWLFWVAPFCGALLGVVIWELAKPKPSKTKPLSDS